MELFIYHFHETSVSCKEHITDYNDDSKGALCGHNHHNLSSNGDAITLEWAKQNIPSASANGTLCKKCAKIAMKMLEEAKIKVQ